MSEHDGMTSMSSDDDKCGLALKLICRPNADATAIRKLHLECVLLLNRFLPCNEANRLHHTGE